jgi:UDPglucose 6-dehydrogenase
MRVTVVGSGYVGLVTGACLATLGHRVTCVDVNARRVERINRGEAPIHETGLPDLLNTVVGSALDATTDIGSVVPESHVIMIAVGTPSREDGSIDLGAIGTVARQIGELLPESTVGRQVVVVKSTVVPGTTAGMVTALLEESSGLEVGRDFGVAMNPEFLTEGQAVADFMMPDRLVVGSQQEWAAETVMRLYDGQDPEAPRIITSPGTAEMIKYASNAMLATAISFSNELANLSAALGDIDIVDVMRGIHASRYLTTRRSGEMPVTAELAAFFEAGCGYGGSCLPKDTAAITALGEESGEPLEVIQAVREINRLQPARLVDIARREYGELDGASVGVLGLAFKPDTDDIRESPAFPVIRRLLEEGARVRAHDPIAHESSAEFLEKFNVEFEPSLDRIAASSDVLVLVTRWGEYDRLPEILSALAQPPLLVDGRRVIDPDSVPRYAGIGLS